MQMNPELGLNTCSYHTAHKQNKSHHFIRSKFFCTIFGVIDVQRRYLCKLIFK